MTDDAGWDDYHLWAEIGVSDKVKAKRGIDLYASLALYFDDLTKIIRSLQIVDNNASASIGGGGTLSRPLAPEFPP